MTDLAVRLPQTELSVYLPAEIDSNPDTIEAVSIGEQTELSIYLPGEISGQAEDFITESEVPLLPASKIGSGEFALDRLPPIPISKIIWLSDETDSTEAMKVPFAYGDATPKLIATIEAGQTVFTVQIVIQVPFNGIGAALALGDDDQGDRLMAVGQNDPLLAAEYETNPAHSYSIETDVLLTIVPGEGCTQGNGYVLLEV